MSEQHEIVITSLNAGGGHKTAMYSIGSILSKFKPQLDFGYFLSEINDFETAQNFFNHHFSWLYEFIYDISDYDIIQSLKSVLFVSQNRKFKNEMIEMVNQTKAGTVITTHFAQTEAILRARHKLKANFKVIAYVPDFDVTTVHFPKVKGKTADGIIAQNPKLLRRLQRKYKLQDSQLQVGGYMVRQEFIDANAVSRTDAREKIAELNFPGAIRLDPERMTLTVVGGSGWVMKAHNKVEQLLKSKVINWDKLQILVICGNNTKAYKEYMKFRSAYPGRKIVPLPFIPYEHMALALRATDLVVMSSLAPATMYELLTVGAGPIFVARVNPAQEKANLQFATENKIVKYIPKTKQLVKSIERFQYDDDWAEKLTSEFRNVAEAQTQAALLNAEQLASFIDRLHSLNH